MGKDEGGRVAMQRDPDTPAVNLRSLLGHPQPLSPARVGRRRGIASGCPEKLAPETHGTLVEIVGSRYALNLVDLTVDELIAALEVETLSSADEAAAALARECWERSELAQGAAGLFRLAAIDGQAFVIVDRDAAGSPTGYVHPTYDGEVGVEVKSVDADGRLTMAVLHEMETLVKDRVTGMLVRLADWLKGLVGIAVDRSAVEYVTRRLRTEFIWDSQTDTTRLRTFATDPGRAERQVVEVGGEWQDAAPGEAGEWPWGMPIIPVVAPSDGEVAPLEDSQRLVNAAALDLAAAARVDSLRIVYTVDCQPVGSGEEIYLQPGVCIELRSLGPEGGGSVGVIPPADLSALIETLKLRCELLLMQARCSVYVLPWRSTGTAYPSGAALLIANAPFRDKVAEHQAQIGTALGRLFATWLRMAGVVGPEVRPVWRGLSYTTRTESLQEVLLMQQAGLPLAEQAAALGMDDERRAAWEEEQTAVRLARLLAVSAQTAPEASEERTAPAGRGHPDGE